MKRWLLEHLVCPFCRGGLHVAFSLETEQDALCYGIVGCGRCGQRFAVVEGILLLIPALSRLDVRSETTDEVVLRGARLCEVLDAIGRRDSVEALCLLLNPTSLDGASWTFDPGRTATRRVLDAQAPIEPPTAPRDDSIAEVLRASLRRPYRGIRRAYREQMLPRWRRALATHLRANRDRLSARSLFELYYGDYSGAGGMADYFVYRFGQPRHLAALCAASLIRGRPGVTLDLACGAGHLTHFLTYGVERARVIGIDREFIRLFIAKHFMAPGAEFVCMAAADATLPFASGSLSGVLCSDAFHYFPQKSVAARELERVLDDEGAMVLTRVANAGLEPHEGYELEPAEYEGLFTGLVTSMRGEGELIEAYLARQLPRLADRRPPEALSTEKWLTLFGSRSERFFRNYGTFEEFPHAVGRLGLNPIYVDEPAPDGGRTLHFRFPGTWYAFEDARYRDYAAPRARVPPEVIEAVDRGRRSPELDALIASFALVGLPERYADPPASPWTRAPSAAPAANT